MKKIDYINITYLAKEWHVCRSLSVNAYYSSGMYAVLTKLAW